MICHDEAIGKAKRKGGGRYEFKARVLRLPRSSGSTSPGTYYWQAHRIVVRGTASTTASSEGPVVKFKVA